MGFDLFVMDPLKRMTPREWGERFGRGLESVGATFADGGISTHGGHRFPFEILDGGVGGSAKLLSVDEEVCAVFFAIAEETGLYLYSPSGTPLMRTPRGVPLAGEEKFPQLELRDAVALQHELQPGFDGTVALLKNGESR